MPCRRSSELPIGESQSSGGPTASQNGGFDTHFVDLLDFALPGYDVPNHPQLQKYAHDHTRRWSESVGSAGAFVFVTPRIQHGVCRSPMNALNYLYLEWNYKPCAFVSYDGISGGLRARPASPQ